MDIQRTATGLLEELIKYFPVISVTGPRQSGKTTLIRQFFKDYAYFSLEDPLLRATIEEDPQAFLAKHSHRVIFDEAQYFPDLFSYLQLAVDEDREPGRFVISGSQNFLLNKNITQSLAGRVGIVRLYPLDMIELKTAGILTNSIISNIYSGFYPAFYKSGVPPKYFYPSYIASYLERDIKGFVAPKNMLLFRKFMQLCATLAGQTLNVSSMATALGISTTTVREWLSILEMSYIVFTLPPYFKNFKKRLVKSSKLYFVDTGLLCYLINLDTEEKVDNYLNKGALFENLIIAERFKALHHVGDYPTLYFYRDSHKVEADLLENLGNAIRLTEIKSTTSYRPKLAATIKRIGSAADVPAHYRVIYGGEDRKKVGEVEVVPWFEAGIK